MLAQSSPAAPRALAGTSAGIRRFETLGQDLRIRAVSKLTGGVASTEGEGPKSALVKSTETGGRGTEELQLLFEKDAESAMYTKITAGKKYGKLD